MNITFSRLIPMRPSRGRWPLFNKASLFSSLLFTAGILSSPATNVTLSASDAAGTNSFLTALHWNNGLAPAAGNAYFTTNFTLRTPNDTVGGNDFVFAGDSLSIDAGGRLLGKIGNGAANNTTADTVTVNNLNLNGGGLDQAGGNTANAVLTLGGNMAVNAASSIGAIGGTANGSTAFETLNIAATISGSAALRVAGSTINGGADSGVVQLSAANPYSGTITVSNNIIASTANRLLQLNNLDAVSNATVNLVGSQASPMSFASGANTGVFKVGGVTGTANQTLNDSAGAAVTLSVGGNNSTSTYAGGFTGSGNLVKSGSGTFTLVGTNTYAGSTVVSNGTLALASGAQLANSSSITVNSGKTFDVSANAFTLSAGQSLLGSGTNKGSITAASGAIVYAGLDQAYGTNTITSNLTCSSGASVYLDLGTTFNGSKDLIVVGGILTLNNTTFHLKAPSTSVNLDTTDYVLMSAGGSTTGNPALTWEVAPLNSAHYSIGKSGNNIILHYNSSLVPACTGAVSPDPVVRNQSVSISVAVTFSSSPVSSVTVDASALGASSSLPLISAGGGIYTNKVVVAPSVMAGTVTLVATVTDSGGLSGNTPGFTVTINTSAEVWSGGAGNNWSTNPNWQSGFAPGYIGDSLNFAGSTQLAPDMGTNYTITDLTFDSTAGSFVLGSSSGNVLTVTGGSFANNSANTQTVNLPITNAGNLMDVTGGNNIVFNAGIAGACGLQNDNSGVLMLKGTNTFTGGITINSGALQIAGAGVLGGTNGNYSGNITNLSVFQYSSSATQTVSGVISFNGIIKDGTGTLILSGANTYFGDTLISNGVLQVTGTLGGGNYSGNITDNDTLQWSGTAAQVLSGVISGSGGLLKDGTGSLTLNAGNTYGGSTIVKGGTLVYNANTITYPTIGSLSVYSNATVAVNANNAAPLPVNNLTLNTNSVLKLNYDFSGGNPAIAAVSVLTSLLVPGTNAISISGFGAVPGQFPLVSYVGSPLPNLNHFTLILPPGTSGNLVNNIANKTIDLNVTGSVPATWIPLTANDASGTSSFTNSGHWADGNLPTTGNGYYTQGFILRSPADANAYTFGGSALSIDAYTSGAGGRFLLKGTNGQVITVTNLILNGGLVDYANVNNDSFTETLAGNILLNGGVTSYLGALGANATTAETLYVTAAISGTGNLQIGGANVNGGTDIGPVVLSGNNTYSGSTTVAGGTLVVSGTAPNTSIIVLTNATFSGAGSIGGTVAVQFGGILAPGTLAQGALSNSIGTLTAGGAVSVSGAVVMKIDRAGSPKTDKLAAPSVTINAGSTLTINNIGSTNLVAGDTFTLFSTSVSGAFSVTNLPVLPSTNLIWANNLAVDGTIKVVQSGPTLIVLTNSPVITNFSLAGNNIDIAGTNGQTGATAYLLTATNLTLPRTQWKTVATNVLGGNAYTFIGTNLVVAGVTQKFYILSSTNYNP